MKSKIKPVFVATTLLLNGVVASALELEEIVITPQKKEQGLQDVSVSVAVVDGDFVNEKAITTIENLSTSLPAVSVAENALSQFLFIRGIGTPGINQGQEQAVGLFSDSVYMGRATLARAPFIDVNRVEVLRGPQSIFFGKNTTAGAIGVYSNDPTEEFEGSVSALYEPNDGETELNLVLSGPLSDDVAARLAIRKYDLDGYQENSITGADTPERDDLAARLKLRWDITDTATLKMSYERNDFDRQGSLLQLSNNLDPNAPTGTVAVIGGLQDLIGESLRFDERTTTGNADARGTAANFVAGGVLAAGGSAADAANAANAVLADTTLPDAADISEGTSDVFIATFDQELENHSLTAVYGYAAYESADDNSGNPGPLPLIDLILDEEYEQHSFELRLQSTSDGDIEYLIGAFYQASELDFSEEDHFGLSLLLPGTPNVGRAYSLDQETDTASLFGSVTWHATAALRTVFGARYQHETKDGRHVNNHFLLGGTIAEFDAFEALNPDLNGNTVGDFDELNVGVFVGALGSFEHDLADEVDENIFNWSAKVEYDLSGDAMVYASASTGAKAGGFDARFVGKPADAADLTFDEEKALNLELGIRQTLFDNRMRVSATLYQTEIDDYQVSIYDGRVNFLVRNAAELRSRGLELEVDFVATENLTIFSALAFLDSEWTSFDQGPCSFERVAANQGNGVTPGMPCTENPNNPIDPNNNLFIDFKGERNIFSPEWSAFLSFDYRREFGELEYASVLDIAYSDEYSTAADLDSRSFYDAWTTVDLRLSVGDVAGTWQVALIGKNLTDEIKGSSRQDVALFDGAYFGQVDRLRSVALQATYNF